MSKTDWISLIGGLVAVLMYLGVFGYCMFELIKGRARAIIEETKAREEAIRAANTQIAKDRRIRPRTPLKPSYPPPHFKEPE